MLEFLAGAGVVFTGVVIDHVRWTRRHRHPKPLKPVCGCKHHLALHDPKTGVCHAVDNQQVRTGTDGAGFGQYKTEAFRCTCRHYVGPITPELMLAQFQPNQMES